MKSLTYYFWATYHRKLLDKILEENKQYYRGIVLDIGGQDRGKFKKPKGKVEKWIFADIVEKHKPDILLDISDMHQIKDHSIDIIAAIEVFEHVEKPEKALQECRRVLKKDGHLILSAPFLFPIHSDPCDYQRWTKDKWFLELGESGFRVEKCETVGRFFSVLGDMLTILIKQLPFRLNTLFRILYPLMDIGVKLDNHRIIKDNKRLNKFTTGYFIVACRN